MELVGLRQEEPGVCQCLWTLGETQSHAQRLEKQHQGPVNSAAPFQQSSMVLAKENIRT